MAPGVRIWGAVLLLAAMPAGAIEYSFTYIDNAEGDFATRGWLDPDSDFQKNVRAGATAWGERLAGDATLLIHVKADRGVARAGGTFSLGAMVGTDSEGHRIFEPGPLTKIMTGVNPGAPPDMFLFFNASFVEDNYWFDPTPDERSDPAPLGMTDFVSIVMHELGHSFGIAGYRSFSSGTLGRFTGDVITNYDAMTFYGGNGEPRGSDGTLNDMFFAGPTASELFGGPVLLTFLEPGAFLFSQNYYHLGTCGDPPILEDSLMSGCFVPVDGSRLEITPIDVAVLADLGYERIPVDADLEVRLDACHRLTGPGFREDILVTVANRGPQPASGIQLEIPAPAQAAPDTAALPAGCAETSGALTCMFQELGAFQQQVVALRYLVDPAATGSLDITAAVGGAEPDPIPGNDASSLSLPVVPSLLHADGFESCGAGG